MYWWVTSLLTASQLLYMHYLQICLYNLGSPFFSYSLWNNDNNKNHALNYNKYFDKCLQQKMPIDNTTSLYITKRWLCVFHKNFNVIQYTPWILKLKHKLSAFISPFLSNVLWQAHVVLTFCVQLTIIEGNW